MNNTQIKTTVVYTSYKNRLKDGRLTRRENETNVIICLYYNREKKERERGRERERQKKEINKERKRQID